MKEFKFRGKRKDNDEWIEGYYGYKDLMDQHFIIVPRLDTNSYEGNQYFVDYEVYGDTVEQIN